MTRGWRDTAGAMTAVAAAVLVAMVIAVVYVRAERAVYFWDYATYWNLTRSVLDRWNEDPIAALEGVLRSIRSHDYNSLPTLPLLPAAKVLGDGRLDYVLSVVAVYLTAILGALLLLCRSMFRDRERAASGWAYAAVLVAPIAFPWTLAPILRGYLDCGGAAIMLGVLWIYFSRPAPSLTGRTLCAIGVLLALAVLFRRWYAFWVVSFFVLMAVDAAARLMAGRTFRPRAWLAVARPVAVVGVVSALFMMAMAAPMVKRMLTTDYADAYAAYKWSFAVSDHVRGLALSFGWGSLALVAACWLTALAWRDTRRFAALLAVQSTFLYAHFTRVQDLSMHHFYLLQPAVLAVVGIVAARAISALEGRVRRGAALAAFAGAGALVSGVVFVPALAPLRNYTVPILPWHAHLPIVRNDLPEYQRLVAAMDRALQDAGPSAELYVLASSKLLSDDHVRQTEVSLGLPPRPRPGLLRTAFIDRRDGFPAGLLAAEVVCTAMPPCTHMLPAHQQVVVQPVLSLMQGTDIGRAFARLPFVFHLDGGVDAFLFRRQREILPEEVAELSARLRAVYPDRPFIYDPPAAR